MAKIIDFFVNIYEKVAELPFMGACIAYCKEHPFHFWVICGLTLLIFIVWGIMRAEVRKANKLAKQQALLESKPQEMEEALPIVEEIVEEPTPIVEEIVEEPAPIVEDVVEEPTPIVEEIVEEPAPIVEDVVEEPAPIVEEIVEEPAPIVEDVVEEPAPIVEEIVEEPALIVEIEAEQPSIAKAVTTSSVNDIDETLAMLEEIEDEDPLHDHYDENEVDRIARHRGKWVICRMITNDKEYGEMFFFELQSANGEKLLESEEYTSYQGILRGIQTHKTNILNGNFKIATTKKGDFMFKLLSGKNMLLCTSASYPTQTHCQNAIDATIRFAATAILDENVQDIVMKAPTEEDTAVQTLPENSRGKWIIFTRLNTEGKQIYYFELLANDGEKLIVSEEYTTYTGAVNGILTHKKNIANNKFRISLTKRGDYVYKILNANGQLLCLSERYKTKGLCQNAVEVVKYFAMNSPMLTEESVN